MSHSDIVVIEYEGSCAAGTGLKALRAAIHNQQSGLRKNALPNTDLNTFIGEVAGLGAVKWHGGEAQWQSRNNALIRLTLEQGNLKTSIESAKAKWGSHRIGVIVGSSTSSIDRAEDAYRHLGDDEHLAQEYNQELVLNPHSPGLYVAHLCGLSGPNITINTACSSSAKVFATAKRWLELGLIDVALVGGADTLCLSVLHGFHSLQLVSTQPCRPFDSDRDGINLGEAAGFALLGRQGESGEDSGIVMPGFGESSDAHHMSHPHPEGAGAELSMKSALKMAKLEPSEIGYINLHGTSSKANDHIEGNIVAKMFPSTTYASSTKGWMGHTLGAAGIIEAIVSMDALVGGELPGTLNHTTPDNEILLPISNRNQKRRVDHVMSNSFGFGGNNCSLIFSAKEARQ